MGRIRGRGVVYGERIRRSKAASMGYSPAREEKQAPAARLDGDAAAGVALAAAKLMAVANWLGGGSSGGERRPEEWKRRRRRV